MTEITRGMRVAVPEFSVPPWVDLTGTVTEVGSQTVTVTVTLDDGYRRELPTGLVTVMAHSFRAGDGVWLPHPQEPSDSFGIVVDVTSEKVYVIWEDHEYRNSDWDHWWTPGPTWQHNGHTQSLCSAGFAWESASQNSDGLPCDGPATAFRIHRPDETAGTDGCPHHISLMHAVWPESVVSVSLFATPAGRARYISKLDCEHVVDGVFRLPPGHKFQMEAGQVTCKQYKPVTHYAGSVFGRATRCCSMQHPLPVYHSSTSNWERAVENRMEDDCPSIRFPDPGLMGVVELGWYLYHSVLRSDWRRIGHTFDGRYADIAEIPPHEASEIVAVLNRHAADSRLAAEWGSLAAAFASAARPAVPQGHIPVHRHLTR
jgi:hypothetical protein